MYMLSADNGKSRQLTKRNYDKNHPRLTNLTEIEKMFGKWLSEPISLHLHVDVNLAKPGHNSPRIRNATKQWITSLMEGHDDQIQRPRRCSCLRLRRKRRKHGGYKQNFAPSRRHFNEAAVVARTMRACARHNAVREMRKHTRVHTRTSTRARAREWLTSLANDVGALQGRRTSLSREACKVFPP